MRRALRAVGAGREETVASLGRPSRGNPGRFEPRHRRRRAASSPRQDCIPTRRLLPCDETDSPHTLPPRFSWRCSPCPPSPAASGEDVIARLPRGRPRRRQLLAGRARGRAGQPALRHRPVRPTAATSSPRPRPTARAADQAVGGPAEHRRPGAGGRPRVGASRRGRSPQPYEGDPALETESGAYAPNQDDKSAYDARARRGRPRRRPARAAWRCPRPATSSRRRGQRAPAAGPARAHLRRAPDRWPRPRSSPASGCPR